MFSVNRKRVVIIATLLLIAIITTFFIFKVIKDNQIEHVSVDEGNYVTIASYNENGDPLHDTSSLSVDQFSKSSITVKLENGVDHSRDYKIIVLQNFIQSDFNVGDQKSKDKSYLINVEPRVEVTLPIEIDIQNDTKEIAILFIKEPEDTVTEFDIHKLAYYEEVYVKRFLVENDREKPAVTYKDPDFHYESEVDDTPIFLSDLKFERKIVPSAEEGSKAYLHFGNLYGDEKLTYAVIALQDWRQIYIFFYLAAVHNVFHCDIWKYFFRPQLILFNNRSDFLRFAELFFIDV